MHIHIYGFRETIVEGGRKGPAGRFSRLARGAEYTRLESRWARPRAAATALGNGLDLVQNTGGRNLRGEGGDDASYELDFRRGDCGDADDSAGSGGAGKGCGARRCGCAGGIVIQARSGAGGTGEDGGGVRAGDQICGTAGRGDSSLCGDSEDFGGAGREIFAGRKFGRGDGAKSGRAAALRLQQFDEAV